MNKIKRLSVRSLYLTIFVRDLWDNGSVDRYELSPCILPTLDNKLSHYMKFFFFCPLTIHGTIIVTTETDGKPKFETPNFFLLLCVGFNSEYKCVWVWDVLWRNKHFNNGFSGILRVP